MVILWDGKVVACPQDGSGRQVVGDVTKQSLLEIWNGEPLCNLRRRLGSGDAVRSEPCQSCDRWRRRHLLGVPLEGFGSFLRENLLRPY